MRIQTIPKNVLEGYIFLGYLFLEQKPSKYLLIIQCNPFYHKTEKVLLRIVTKEWNGQNSRNKMGKIALDLHT